MSHDALRHLVQRTLQPEPVVGPRLPARYEGGGGVLDTEIERHDEVTAEPTPTHPSSTGIPDSGPEPSRTRATQRDLGVAEPPRRRRDDSQAAHPAVAVRRVLAETAAALGTWTLPITMSEVHDPAETGTARAVLVPDPRPASEPAAPPPVEQPRPVEPLKAGQQRASAVTPRPAALTPAGLATAQEPARPEPESVVHITIGRVEVRAAPSPTPSRSPETPPERRVMSLAEYLDRRGAGSST